MNGQLVGDLRTLVVRRAGLKRRVVVLAADGGVEKGLRENGCEVLMNPDDLEQVAAFSPEVIVAFDSVFAEGVRGLEALVRAAPQAELVCTFVNAGSAGVLLRALLGESVSTGHSERDVQKWLAQAGYVVASRDVVVMPHEKLPLSADTEAAMRQLFEQLNPSAAIDRLLVVARRGAVASSVEREPGLTSLIIVGDARAALEGTVRSAAGQLHTPLELVVVSSLPVHEVEEIVQPAKGRMGLTVTVLGGTGGDALTQTNLGLSRARGQYVCALEAGELMDRSHVASLVESLQQGTNAWALSNAPDIHEHRFSLREWLEARAVQRGRFVVDRERLGAFSLELASGVPEAEAMLFCRLAALFEPAFVHAPPTLDSPREVKSDVAAIREVLSARALRRIGTLDEQLVPLTEMPLAALLEARLTERNQTVGKVFGQARELMARVRHAAQTARQQAKEELERERS